MEAQVIRFSGTPEEVARAVALLEAGVSPNREPVTPPASPLPSSVENWMNEWAVPQSWRPAYRSVLEQASKWQGVQLKLTKGREGASDSAGRIRFVYEADRRGFAFLHHRGRLFLNPGSEIDLADFPMAERRSGKAAKGRFNTAIYVRSADAVDQAIELLRKAYERASSRSSRARHQGAGDGTERAGKGR